MWYFAWILGLPLAITLAIINVIIEENLTNDDVGEPGARR